MRRNEGYGYRMDLLAENNICGQTILRLVARGNSIIAELMRLSDYVPSVFKLETKSELQKYGDVILDFSYFKSPNIYDKKIEDSQVLLELDEEIRESHDSFLKRIYSAFESIHRYISDLLSFLQDLSDSVYIQKTLEVIFLDEDGKQLMCEALYLYGTMLLLVETLFPGVIRERLIVGFHRHVGVRAVQDTHIDDVCKLLRSTGFSSAPGAKRPPNYPENYFGRIHIPEMYIDLVVGYLRSDDIYHQMQAYPFPDHRSTAMATQGAMLYVCLLFAPSTLHNHTSRMREIVDKFFSDNWVISYYMGRTVNLAESWDPYKAAKQALNNTLEISNVKHKAQYMSAQLGKLVKQTEQTLADGKLTEIAVLDHSAKILNLSRQCNVVLRWVILHTSSLSLAGGENSKRCQTLRQQVLAEMEFKPLVLFNLLLKTSIVELSLSETYKKLVAEKEEKWNLYRKSAQEQVLEIAEVFAGSRPLAKVSKNDRLNQWFKDIADQILGLSLDSPALSGRKIIQIIQALKQVKEFHDLDSSAGVVQAVKEVVNDLQALVKVSAISDDDLVTLAMISDLSYAWNLIENYTKVMQDSIKKTPSHVAPLRAVFLKLSSGLELPLMRINQAKSEDLMSVSAYYSGQLVSYIRKVLQIIPETMFSLLEQIVHLQTSMLEIPTRLDKDKIKDFAQLDKRYKMAESTQRVGVLAEGISMMKSTLVGVVQIDPRKLLDEGVRRELVLRVATSLHEGFIFNPKAKGSELQKRLEIVGRQMNGFQTSFEYIQDYINMYGLKMWQEEMTRIINYNVEQECNQLLKKKKSDHESSFQSTAIPIPRFPPVDNVSVNFIGRLLREILRITNPKTTVYVPQLETWYDSKTHNELLSSTIMQNVEKAVCVAGLAGIDKLLAFLIVRELQELVKDIEKKVYNDSVTFSLYEEISTRLGTQSNIVPQPQRHYTGWIQKTQKFNIIVIDRLLKIGQLQILRCQVGNKLNISCKFQSKLLSCALEALNASLLLDIQSHYANPTKPYPDPDGTLTCELSSYLERCGMNQPIDKIYVTPKPFNHLSVILLIAVISQTTRIFFSKNVGSLISMKGYEGVDGPPLVIGISTLLRQFHPDHTDRYFKLLGQYISSLTLVASTMATGKNTELPNEVMTALALFHEVAQKMAISRDSQATYLPPNLLDEYSG